MERCLLCGKLSDVNSDGICKGCEGKMEKTSSTDKDESKRYMGQCRGCGKQTVLNVSGYCEECIQRFGKAQQIENVQKSNVQPVESVLPKAKLTRKFYSFYKFFHTGSIITSIILFVGWIIYAALGSTANQAQQQTTMQSYQYGATQSAAQIPFNYHFGILAFAVLILIFGLFLSYVSAALCKWVENMKK